MFNLQLAKFLKMNDGLLQVSSDPSVWVIFS